MRSLILASTSFRRQELLKWTGLEFKVVAPEFEEALLPRASFPSTSQYVEALSYGKALSVSHLFPDSYVLSGDTVVECNGKVIGKPRDLEHAKEILHYLSGKMHTVYSGVAVVETSSERYLIDSVKTEVTFKKLSDEQIEKYVQTGEPLGKAGAYGINLGAKPFVEKVDGSLTNVIGFPLGKVCSMLSEFGIKIPIDIHAVIEKYLGVKE